MVITIICFSCFSEPVGGLQAALEKSLAQYRQFVQDDAEVTAEDDEDDEDWFGINFFCALFVPLICAF